RGADVALLELLADDFHGRVGDVGEFGVAYHGAGSGLLPLGNPAYPVDSLDGILAEHFADVVGKVDGAAEQSFNNTAFDFARDDLQKLQYAAELLCRHPLGR
ncbi:unnamed protein product, partial [Ectocarpus sp. 12 AP-2014]